MYAGGLARISHRPSTTHADLLAVSGRTPCSRLDVVSATPSPSSDPCPPSQRHLDALATNGGERCGLAGYRRPSPGAYAYLIPASRESDTHWRRQCRRIHGAAPLSHLPRGNQRYRPDSRRTEPATGHPQGPPDRAPVVGIAHPECGVALLYRGMTAAQRGRGLHREKCDTSPTVRVKQALLKRDAVNEV